MPAERPLRPVFEGPAATTCGEASGGQNVLDEKPADEESGAEVQSVDIE